MASIYSAHEVHPVLNCKLLCACANTAILQYPDFRLPPQCVLTLRCGPPVLIPRWVNKALEWMYVQPMAWESSYALQIMKGKMITKQCDSIY